LPNLTLITEPAKTADMISIASRGLCGEDDFRHRREKEALISSWKEGNFSGKKLKLWSR